MNGEKLKQLRETRGISRAKLAELTGIGLSTIGTYERGGSSPDADALKKICEVLNVSADYLLGLTDQEGEGTAPDVQEGGQTLPQYLSRLVYDIAARDHAAPYERDCLQAVQAILETADALIRDADALYAETQAACPSFQIGGSYEEILARSGVALGDPASLEAQRVKAQRGYEDTLRARAENAANSASYAFYLDLLQRLTGKTPITLTPIEEGQSTK